MKEKAGQRNNPEGRGKPHALTQPTHVKLDLSYTLFRFPLLNYLYN